MADYLELKQLMLAGDIDATADACLKLVRDPPEQASGQSELKTACELGLKSARSIDRSYSREVLRCAEIVAIAFLPISKLHRLQSRVPVEHEALVMEVLTRRPRAFRDAWVDIVMQRSVRPARIVHRLITGGLARAPEGDMLVLALMQNPWEFDSSVPAPRPREKSSTNVLRDNAVELEGLIWRLFEVEGRSDERRNIHTRFSHGWPQTFIELSNDKTLERERVLESSLVALSRGFSAYHSTGFIELHDGLTPSQDEQERHLGDYLRLCTSPTGAIVKFALRSMRALQLERPLDPVQVLSEIGPALLTPAKSTASLAIKILVACVQETPDRRLAGAEALLPALRHPKAEIQLEAARQMRAWFAIPPKILASQIELILEQCHVRSAALLNLWLSTEATPATIARPIAFPPTTIRDTRFADVQWLRPDRTLPSPRDDHALLELASTTLEQPRGADQIESLVAGLAACDRLTLRSKSAATTIAKRSLDLLDRDPPDSQRFVASCLVASFMPNEFARPMLSEFQTRHLTNSTDRGMPVSHLLFHRFSELSQRLCSEESFVPLATPTHLGGVIDPVVFAERVIDSPTMLHPTELQCALLRLAPCAVQLTAASEVLNHSTTTPARIIAWVEGWVDHCRRFESHSVPWREHLFTNAAGRQVSNFRIDHHSSIEPLSPDQVAILIADWTTGVDRTALDLCASLLPGLPALVAELGVANIGTTNGPARHQYDKSGTMRVFFDETLPMNDAAHLMLALGINKPTPVARATAIDLAVAVSHDRRLNPELFGRHIGALCSTGVVTPSRYGPALAEVAGAMNQPYTMVEVLESVLTAHNSSNGQQLLSMLELLESLVVELGCGVATSALTVLTSLSESSRNSKTANRILSLVEA